MRWEHRAVAVVMTSVVGLGIGFGGHLSRGPDPDGRTVIAPLAPSGRPLAQAEARTLPSRPAGPGTSPPRLTPRPPADGRDAPDPFLLGDVGHWVLYTTQVGALNVPVATTKDLEHWSPPADALPELPAWAEEGRTWAPGVLRRPDGFRLYFVARSRATGGQCIGVATSATATGPFTSPSATPFVCQPELGGSIDPHPFVDRDGTAYLTWKADGNAIGRASELFAQRLGPDGLTLEGTATPLLRNDAAWEAPLVENPALALFEDRYVLLYSGGWWESDGYAIGYAVCESPLGPCAKATTDHPLHATGAEVAGPGGASTFTGPAGDVWLAYHAWTPGAVGYGSGGVRGLRFAMLRGEQGSLAVAPDPAVSPGST